MGAMTNYLKKKLLDKFLGIQDYPPPAALFISLHKESPTDTGSFVNEVSTSVTGYTRQSITAKMNETDPTTGESVNSDTIFFATITEQYGTVSHLAISDAATGGNMLFYGPLTEPQDKGIGE